MKSLFLEIFHHSTSGSLKGFEILLKNKCFEEANSSARVIYNIYDISYPIIFNPGLKLHIFPDIRDLV